jgi:hypothetical protein
MDTNDGGLTRGRAARRNNTRGGPHYAVCHGATSPSSPLWVRREKRLDGFFRAYTVDWQNVSRRDADWGDRVRRRFAMARQDGRAPQSAEIVSQTDRHERLDWRSCSSRTLLCPANGKIGRLRTVTRPWLKKQTRPEVIWPGLRNAFRQVYPHGG